MEIMHLEQLTNSVKIYNWKGKQRNIWNKGVFFCINIIILCFLQLMILYIIVLQAMTNLFTLKTVNGMFEMACEGGDACV